MVQRRLGRNRREHTALRTAAEDHSARRRAGADADDARDPAPVAGSGDDDRLHRIAVVLNPSKFAETESIRQRLSELVERIEGAETVFYETTIDDPGQGQAEQALREGADLVMAAGGDGTVRMVDRKSTRLNSSHVAISYAVFCLKKKKEKRERSRADVSGTACKY